MRRLLAMTAAIAVLMSPLAPAEAVSVASTAPVAPASTEPAIIPRPRIVGGSTVPDGKYPFVVALQDTGFQFCGGSIVAPTWVLTAAHCVTDGAGNEDILPADVDVVIGRYDLTSGAGTVIVATDILVHPLWDGSNDGVFEYDLALLELTTSTAAAPVVLATTADVGLYEGGDMATAMGWGWTNDNSGPGSTILKEVDFPMIDNATCNTIWSPSYDTASEICGGTDDEDACIGDSGGPLIAPPGTSGWKQIGVVSSGPVPCAQAAAPGIYAEVAAGHAWISSTAGLNVAPTAVDDAYSLDEDGTSTTTAGSGVAANDTDPEDGTPPGGTVTLGTPPASHNGAFTLAGDGSFTYTPIADFNGGDSFTYTITDSGGLASNVATVTITIDPVNDEPSFTKGADQVVLEDAGAQTVAGWATGISPGPADESGQTVSFLVSNDNNALFAAQPAVAGDDMATAMGWGWTNDNSGPSSTILKEVDIPMIDNATCSSTRSPFYDADSEICGGTDDEDACLGDSGGPLIAPPGTSGWKQIGVVSAGPVPCAQAALPGIYAEVAAGYAWISSTVGLNMAPAAVDDAYSLDEEGVAPLAPAEAVSMASTPPFRGATPEPLIIGGPGPRIIGGSTVPDGKYPFVVALQDTGFQFCGGSIIAPTWILTAAHCVTDSSGNENILPADIDVVIGRYDLTTGAGEVIVATDILVHPLWDGTTDGVFEYDIALLELTTATAAAPVALATAADVGLYDASTGALTYTPAADANGSATVTVSAMDDGGTANGGDDTSPPQMFTITVTSVNDEPSFTKGAHQVVLEDAGPQTVAGWATGISPGPANESGQTVSFLASNDNNALFATQPVVGGTGALTYTPAADANGSAIVTVSAMDDGGTANGGDDTSPPQTFTITVDLVADTVGLVDPTQGKWYLRNSAGVVTSFFYGNPGDIPFMGDWDGDGIDTPGLFRQSDAFVYLKKSNAVGNADIRFFFGDPGDEPIVGDFDGDGDDTVGIYRPSNQRFFIINELGQNNGGLGAAAFSFTFGNPGDKPVTGDWDGDGITEVGLHRESTGLFYWRNTLTTGNDDGTIFFGDPGDRFVSGDWGNIDGTDTPAIFRPGDVTYFFRHTLTEGNADSQFMWTGAGSDWSPVAGVFGLDPKGPGGVPPDPGDSKNCSDFGTQADAQAWHDFYFPYYGDVANLDSDNDGAVCESLP